MIKKLILTSILLIAPTPKKEVLPSQISKLAKICISEPNKVIETEDAITYKKWTKDRKYFITVRDYNKNAQFDENESMGIIENIPDSTGILQKDYEIVGTDGFNDPSSEAYNEKIKTNERRLGYKTIGYDLNNKTQMKRAQKNLKKCIKGILKHGFKNYTPQKILPLKK